MTWADEARNLGLALDVRDNPPDKAMAIGGANNIRQTKYDRH